MATPSAIRAIDRRLIDDAFEMDDGYVLDLTEQDRAVATVLQSLDGRRSAEGADGAAG